jgi:hypothetical protein
MPQKSFTLKKGEVVFCFCILHTGYNSFMLDQGVQYEQLKESDLVVDQIYHTGPGVGKAGEPIAKLMPGAPNSSGFRISGGGAVGKVEHRRVKYAALHSTGKNNDWPDFIDNTFGRFTYFGDNKKPGRELHSTQRRGNLFLRNIFEDLHSGNRIAIPPCFVFISTGHKHDVQFKGLAIPGVEDIGANGDLLAIWRTKDNQRFQNYKALFTILDVPVIDRKWIKDLAAADDLYPCRNMDNAPDVWKQWIDKGVYNPLLSPEVNRFRTKEEQLPTTKDEIKLLNLIENFCLKCADGDLKKKGYIFESIAIEIAKIVSVNIEECVPTRYRKDGGRDAVGKYRIGLGNLCDPVDVEFSLEAKCYAIDNPCGVGDTKRLLSRLRHRQFGIFVTTSFIGQQAYKEIIEDRHPVLIICGGDICKALIHNGYGDTASLEDWLHSKFGELVI